MGQPGTNPETVVLNLLDTHASLVAGTNLFSCPPQPESSTFPRACVFVWSPFNAMPKTYLNNTKDDRSFWMDVLVRYPIDYAEGLAIARGAWALLHRADLSAYTGYVMLLALSSDPRYMGVDDADNHRWVFTVELRFVG